MTAAETLPGPLAGLRILELADEKGQFCGKLMGDLGADVIKIEPPGGEATRRVGPFLDDIPHPERSLSFGYYNTSKRGITLNLETADGRHVDQIKNLIGLVRTDPYSRRQIVTAWNPGEIERMALAPCHCLFQTQVAAGRLNLQLYQRSADVFLGVPFNIASYALLTHMLARECGLEPGVFVWTGGDCHLYSNHLEQARLQLTREPRTLPRLVIKDRGQDLFSYEAEDFMFENYEPHPHISAPVAV